MGSAEAACLAHRLAQRTLRKGAGVVGPYFPADGPYGHPPLSGTLCVLTGDHPCAFEAGGGSRESPASTSHLASLRSATQSLIQRTCAPLRSRHCRNSRNSASRCAWLGCLGRPAARPIKNASNSWLSSLLWDGGLLPTSLASCSSA